MKLSLSILSRMGLTLPVLKTALASGLSWLVASLLSQNHYPYFAPLAAILTVQVTVAGSMEKATQRIIGIIGGVIVSSFIGHWFLINTASITLVVLIGMAVSTALRLNPQIVSQVAISSLLVLAFGRTPGYAVGRIVETMIGSAIAVAINAIVIPPNAIPLAEQRISDLSERLAAALRGLSIAWKDEENDLKQNLVEVRQLVEQTEKSLEAVKLARQSLRYSPFLSKRRTRLEQIAAVMGRLEHITIQVRGIARGLVDLSSSVDGTVYLSYAMESTARCVALFGQTIKASESDMSSSLKIAIAEAQTKQSLCLLDLQRSGSITNLRDIGGILTDLNRILREVSGEDLIVTGREPTTD